MKELNIFKDFHQLNISGNRHVKKLLDEIDKIGLKDETEIVLSLEGCQTDYPETPKLIDYFLSHLCRQIGEKSLLIKFNGLGTKEVYILYDLILEGQYFDIHEKIDSDEELSKWKDKINTKLKNDGITMTVENTSDNATFTYGGH